MAVRLLNVGHDGGQHNQGTETANNCSDSEDFTRHSLSLHLPLSSQASLPGSITPIRRQSRTPRAPCRPLDSPRGRIMELGRAGGRSEARRKINVRQAGWRKEVLSMNTITRWDPFRELDELQSRLSTLFGRAALRKNGAKDEAVAVAEWAPLVDIVEDDNEYLIKAELPEVKKEDVKVTVQDDVLTISGERMFEKEEKDRKYHRMERAYGSFARSFTLPEDADGEKVAAEFKDGVLKVHLPKSEQAKPKSIEVKIG